MTGQGSEPREESLVTLGKLVVGEWLQVKDAMTFTINWHNDGAHQAPRPSCAEDCDLCADARHASKWADLLGRLENAVKVITDDGGEQDPLGEWDRNLHRALRKPAVSTPPWPGPCPCVCNQVKFCGGCGHAGCGRRRPR